MNKLKVLFVYPNCMLDNLIPIGASSVIGALKSLCLKSIKIEIELFDTTFYKTQEKPDDFERVENLQILPFKDEDFGISIRKEDVFEDFRKKVLGFKPNIIMLSVVEATYQQGINLLQKIKDIKPYVIAGGTFAILSSEEIIENEYIDAVCIGEGENSAVEFCKKFIEGKDFTSLKGIWFKDNGKIKKNPQDDLVDLNAMPFLDFSLYEKERFYKPMQGKFLKMVPIEFSRGCPYRCSYCANHAMERHFKLAGNWYRWKSIDRIFAEIEEYLIKYKVEFLYFVSETFLSMPKEMFNEFYERYNYYKIPFWFNTRPESITEEKIEKLKKLNCFRIGIGLEHGNPDFRKEILNRNVSNEKIIKACKLVEKLKISYSINNIIGFPGETRELIFDTIMLNKRIKPDTIGTFIFTPYKGTDLYDYCLKQGFISKDSKVGNLNKTSILENNILSQEEIKGLLRAFPLYVHFDKEHFPLIEKAEKFNEEGNKIFKKLAKRYIKEHFC